MTSILPIHVVHLRRLATCLALLVISAQRTVGACEALPDLHIAVTTEFQVPLVRNDYTLADISALAHRQAKNTGREPLGFYTSEFDYTINIAPDEPPACPARLNAIVTLRLRNRVIEIGQEAAANQCLYPAAVQHYRRLAEADEQTVQQFGARAAATLAEASGALKQVHPSGRDNLDATLREQIRAVINAAIAPLPAARQDAQQAINNPGELTQLARSCSI